MEQGTLQQIISEMRLIVKEEVGTLSKEVNSLKEDINKLNQKVDNLQITIENEVRPNIKIIAEGHTALNEKLDTLKDIDKKVNVIHEDITILKSITKDNLYDIKALQAVR